MNRLQLHALLRMAKELSGHGEFVIVGSLVILGAVADPPDAITERPFEGDLAKFCQAS